MYTLLRTRGWRAMMTVEGPSLATSLFVAERLYLFHSFTLEFLSFLATWVGFGWLFAKAGTLVARAVAGRT